MFDAVEYETTLREDLLSSPQATFLVPGRVLSVSCDDKGCTFICLGKWFKKDKLDPFFVQDDLALLPDGREEEMTIRIDPVGGWGYRMRMNRGKAPLSHETPMTVPSVPYSSSFSTEKGVDRYVISLEEIQIEINLQQWSITVYSLQYGSILLNQYTGDDHSISAIVKEQNSAFQESYGSFKSSPPALCHDAASGKDFSIDAVEMHWDDHFYGFGEKFGDLDKRGREMVQWHCDAVGVSSERTYKNIPFFMCSRGYGIFCNTSAKSRFQMGSHHYKTWQMVVHEPLLDSFYIFGPSLKKILSRYTDITGKPRMVPDWSFGIWMSKNTYRSQEELLSVAKEIRERKLPCDVIHLDVGWFEKEWMCDFEFSTERFPDVATMSRELKELGFHLSIWQLPYIKKENKLYSEAAEKGYFARRPEGGVSTKEADGVIDVTNPEAVIWYKGLMKKLLSQGASVIKADFGESAEADAIYYGGDGEQIHNLYPLPYNKLAWEAVEEETGEGIIWGRSAYAGSQRYPLHWGGDSDSDFHGLYHSLRGGLSFGLSGFPFWSHDVGGYFQTPSLEVYIRWLQFGMFTSHVRFHGTTSREPWNFGPQAEAVYRRYASLRYRLMPYILTQARISVRESLPLLRAMVLEFEDDPTVCTLDDQYMFGESILVAPVLDEQRERKIYLPAGCDWFDYQSKERFEGGQWITYPAPLDLLPLFVKEGSVLFHGAEIESMRDYSQDAMKGEIYGLVRGEFFVETSQGMVYFNIEQKSDQMTIRRSDNGASVSMNWFVFGSDPVTIKELAK